MKRLLVITGLISTLLLLFTSSFALAFEDTPCVQNVYIAPSSIYSGSTVTIRVEATNLVLDVTSLRFIFKSSSGKEKKDVNLVFDRDNNTFTGTLAIDGNEEKGTSCLESAFFKYMVNGKTQLGAYWLKPVGDSASDQWLKRLRSYFIPDPKTVSFCLLDGSPKDMELYNVESYGKWGYINKAGEMMIEPQYLFASDFFNGLALIAVSSKKWGYINKNGQEIIKPQYDQGNDFSEGYAAVRINKKYGYIDILGKVVIDFKYDYASPFLGGIAAIKIGGKYGFIDKTGKVLISPIYDDVKDLSENMIAVKENGKWGYIDKVGKTVIKPTFSNASSFSDNMAAVQVGTLWGFIDKSGRLVVTTKYDMASDFNEGLAAVSSNRKLGYIDKQGSIVIPQRYELPDFNNLSNFNEGFAAVKINDKYGFIDKNNRIKIEPQFSFILTPFCRGMAFVSTGMKTGYINTQGQFIWARDIK